MPKQTTTQQAVMAAFYKQSQTNPDPLARAIAWRCYLSMQAEGAK